MLRWTYKTSGLMVGNLHMCLCRAALFVILGKRFRMDSWRAILQPAIAICFAACKTFHFILYL
jgi:hypothetical protein